MMKYLSPGLFFNKSHHHITPLLGFIIVILGLTNPLSAQIVDIPDPNFKAYLVNNEDINTNGDDEIQESEAAEFTGHLDCHSLEILDLKGIEAFTSLNWLNCGGNPIDSLDFSANFALDTLICYPQYLFLGDSTSVEISLQYLNVESNVNLISLQLSGWYQNGELEHLDVSNCPELRELSCGYHELTALDLSNNPLLESLVCYGNNISTLDVSNCALLENLDCSDNNLTELNVENNPLLVNLECRNNIFSSLDLSNNLLLEEVDCSNNNLTEIIPLSEAEDAIGFENLVLLDCKFNNLTSLNISNCSVLEVLFCRSNELTNLDLRNGNNENLNFPVSYGIGNTYYYDGVWATGNPNLSCVDVDDPEYSNSNWLNLPDWYFSDSNGGFDDGILFSESCATVSINEREYNKARFTIYPNPARDLLTIEWQNATGQLSIYSQTGQLVHQQRIDSNYTTINVSSLSPGVYFAEIIDGTEMQQTRVVIADR